MVKCPMLLAAMLLTGLIVLPLFGGVLWGIATTAKPQLMLFALLALLVGRNWQVLAGMALGSSLMVVASVTFLDPSLWERWIGAIIDFNEILQGGVMAQFITPAGAAVSAGLPTLPFVVAGLALGTSAIAIVAPKVECVQLVALITATSLVASPYAHHYDSIALIPACAVLMLHGRWIYAEPAGLIFIGTPLATISAMVLVLIVAAIETQFRITVGWPDVLRPSGPTGPTGPTSHVKGSYRRR